MYRTEADRLARFEEEVAKAFNYSIVVSEKEARALRQRVSERPIAVIPNGVDLEYFSPSGEDSSSMHSPIIIFTGAMDYFPNIDAVRYFCQEIFPLIRKASPAAEFYIVGRKPTHQVRKLSRQPGVIVTGGVPDVRPYLAKAKVAVAPLRIARGIQNKVLEAMAMGLPVVGTSEVFEGVQATVADGIRIADDPKEFARTVLSLLEDPDLRHHCSLQSRSYVQRHHSWQDHGARLESLLHEMIGESDSHEAMPHTHGRLG
jgi:sugar transferase (PEP-CTERM/EpsH1 system associated)